MCETFTTLCVSPIRTLINYICPSSSSSSASASATSGVPPILSYGRYYPGSGMRRYDSDISNANAREEDAGYVADSSSSSSDYGDGEDRPLLKRGISFERYNFDPSFCAASASVETVILAKKMNQSG